jgi:probable HAF family extracellular repeat protein
MHDLGILGGSYCNANAVNASGQVVGSSSTTENGDAHAFLYTGVPGHGGHMIDLGTLGGTYSEAWAINDAGQIAGEARDADINIHAVLLTPVKE